MNCQRIGQVHAYYDGEMPVVERAEFESHLQACSECRDLLAELRSISISITSAPVAEISQMSLARLQNVAIHAAEERSVMRIAGWLTAAAAAVLLGAILWWPHEMDDALRGSTWQTAAVMPPAESHDDLASASTSDPVVLAEWMASDLSPDQGR